MTSLLFNAPYWLLALLVLVAVALIFTGLRRQQGQLRIAGIALIALAALLLVLRLTVMTDEKRVERDARSLVEAVGHNNWTTAARHLEHARLLELEDGALAARAQSICKLYGLTGIKVNALEVRREPNVITVTLSLTSQHSGQFADSVPSNWVFEYQKQGKEWTLMQIVPVSIGYGGAQVTWKDIAGGIGK